MNDNTTFDIAVIGGGLAGTAAAIALSSEGLNTVHLAPPAPPDRRTSALMMPTIDFLKQAGLLPDPAAIGHPLTRIRIIDATGRLIRAPETLFDSAEAGLEAFGWNLPNAALLDVFAKTGSKLKSLTSLPAPLKSFERTAAGFRLTTETGESLDTHLLVGADGKKSMTRQQAGISVKEHAFAQSALVCDLELARPLDGCSVEFHYPDGPFTLVPAGDNRANLVWIDKAEILANARSQNPDTLSEMFYEKSQHIFGTIEPLTPAFVFPLTSLKAETAGHNGIALVGEAAHAFPPIGAQGLNLGLRDVAGLVDTVSSTGRDDTHWAENAVTLYARTRESDLQRTGLMVDTLFRSLLTDMLPAQTLRAGGLWALKSIPGLRKSAFAAGMGNH